MLSVNLFGKILMRRIHTSACDDLKTTDAEVSFVPVSKEILCAGLLQKQSFIG